MMEPDRRLGWSEHFADAWDDLGRPGSPGRVTRLDRGWSTVARTLEQASGAAAPDRVRNIGAEVAVGDWLIASDDGERVQVVLPRRSAFTRRASFDGMRAVSQTVAANVDVVVLPCARQPPEHARHAL